MLQRFGFGYDSHAFGAPRPLILGGVPLEHETGLIGHSDGDAVAHAVIDALLGASAMGDIGKLFPDTDPQWKDVDSMSLLGEVKIRLRAAGYRVVNVDVTVVTEAPRLADHTEAMCERLAQELAISLDAVSVKAKTNERMDAVGRGDGLIVYAIASIGSDGP